MLWLFAAIASLPRDPRLALALPTLRIALIRQAALSIAVTKLAPPVLQLRKAVITLHAPLAQLSRVAGLADAADLATLHVTALGKVLPRLRARTRLARAVVRVAEESFRAVLAAISAGVVATVLQEKITVIKVMTSNRPFNQLTKQKPVSGWHSSLRPLQSQGSDLPT